MDKTHIEREVGVENIVNEINIDNIYINDFMERYGKRDVDLLCIDTEGLDFEIITSIDFNKYRPAFMQCEPGGSERPFVDYLRTKNYELIAITDVNAIFFDTLSVNQTWHS